MTTASVIECNLLYCSYLMERLVQFMNVAGTQAFPRLLCPLRRGQVLLSMSTLILIPLPCDQTSLAAVSLDLKTLCCVIFEIQSRDLQHDRVFLRL